MLIWLQAWLRSKIACVPQILSCLGHTKFSESANPRAEAVRMPEWVPMYRYLVPNARYRCQLTASIEYTQVQKFAWWLVLACRNREHMQCFAQSQHRSCAVPILLRTVPPFQTYQSGGKMGQISPTALPKPLVILGPVWVNVNLATSAGRYGMNTTFMYHRIFSSQILRTDSSKYFWKHSDISKVCYILDQSK